MRKPLFLQWNYFPPDPVDSPLLNFFLNTLSGPAAGQARAQRAEQGGGARYIPYPNQGVAPQPGLRIQIQSGPWIRIRIRNLNLDPDSEGQKLPTKVKKNWEIPCYEVLDVLFWELKALFCNLTKGRTSWPGTRTESRAGRRGQVHEGSTVNQGVAPTAL